MPSKLELILAEPSVVTSDLATGSVHGSYHSVSETNYFRQGESQTSKSSPEDNEIGSHVPSAAGVLQVVSTIER